MNREPRPRRLLLKKPIWRAVITPSVGTTDVAAEIKRIKAEIAERQARLDAIRAALDEAAPSTVVAFKRATKEKRR